MGDATSLLIGLVFGSIGVGYCIYGKKQRRMMAFISGLALIGLPYVVTSNLVLVVASLVAMCLPVFIKL